MGNIFKKQCVVCKQIKHCQKHKPFHPYPHALQYCDSCWRKAVENNQRHRREIEKEEEDGIYVARFY